MGAKMKVMIVGLPLFARRLAKDLQQFDPSNEYIHLDTYYSKVDKFRALFLIPKADIIFSINGSLLSSTVFDMALKKKIPLIMNWVGTDVTKAVEAFNRGEFRKDYIERAIHFCEVNWIREELLTIGIHAEVVNFAVFEKQPSVRAGTNERLKVLSYIPEERSEFYGMSAFLNLAKNNPDVDFVIAGSLAKQYAPLPENLTALGWVDNMDRLFAESDVCLRFPEHDGLSNFILEALANGKQVIYKYNYNHCIQAINESELQRVLDHLKSEHKKGKDLTNFEGVEFMKATFNKARIFGELLTRFKTIHEQR